MSRSSSGIDFGEWELQEALVGKVKWRVVPNSKNLSTHEGIVYRLLGAITVDDSVVVCSCGWAMRMGGTVRVREAEKIFEDHI
jgi:hypothetical protein